MGIDYEEAEIINEEGLPSQAYEQQLVPQPSQQLFDHPSDLRVIQEYNHEDNMPLQIRQNFWGLISKSIKLGFWDKSDEKDIFIHKNLIKVGYIMSNSKHKYTFAQRQNMNMLDLLVYADFKRGIGMERYRINERTLQASSIQQTIQGGAPPGPKSGIFSGMKSFFG